MPAYAIMSNYGGKTIDHRDYPRRCRQLSDAELLFTIADCRETIAAWPDTPNAGYYLDEINYCADELARRRRGGKRQRPANLPAATLEAAMAAMLED